MSAEVADVLEAAAEVIVEHGWTQGETRDRLGRVCAIGAIQACMDTRSTFPFIDAVKRHNRIYGRPLYEWNDDPRRTAPEVIAALRNAAAAERAS